MGWTEEDFYNTTPKAIYLAQKGYENEKELQQHYLRRQAYIIHCSLVEKPMNPQDLWPIGDETRTADREAEEMKRRIEKRDRILKELKENISQGG